MPCPNCQQSNRSDANYCKHCGLFLAHNCPRCQSTVQNEARFCDYCGLNFQAQGSWNPTSPAPSVALAPLPQPAGETISPDLAGLIPAEMANKLDEARSSQTMVGERRIVTMLFCDVQGSTSAASLLDPEDWTGIMNRAFELMIEPVYFYEGTVARLMGDAILAFFWRTDRP